MKFYIISTIILCWISNQAFSNPFGDGSYNLYAEVIDGVQIISELEKNEVTYRIYNKAGITHFSLQRDGAEEAEELCSFSQGITHSGGFKENYIIVDVLESDNKVTFLVANASAYAVVTLTDVNKIPKDHFIFGLIGFVNEKWFVSAMVYSAAFEPIPGWCHEDYYEYAKLVNHDHFEIKEKAKATADIYKIKAEEIQKNGVKAANAGSPRFGLLRRADLLVCHKWVISMNGMKDSEIAEENSKIVEEMGRRHGGKARFFEILDQMNDQTKANEIKSQIEAAYENK